MGGSFVVSARQVRRFGESSQITAAGRFETFGPGQCPSFPNLLRSIFVCVCSHLEFNARAIILPYFGPFVVVF